MHVEGALGDITQVGGLERPSRSFSQVDPAETAVGDRGREQPCGGLGRGGRVHVRELLAGGGGGVTAGAAAGAGFE